MDALFVTQPGAGGVSANGDGWKVLARAIGFNLKKKDRRNLVGDGPGGPGREISFGRGRIGALSEALRPVLSCII